jgi:hypothetical protein
MEIIYVFLKDLNITQPQNGPRTATVGTVGNNFEICLLMF